VCVENSIVQALARELLYENANMIPPANFQRNGRCTINAGKHFLVNKA